MPINNGCHHITEYIASIALPSFYEHERNVQVDSTQSISIPACDFTCFICDNKLNSPIKLSCGSLSCSFCLRHWIESSQSIQCPSCDTYHLLTTTHVSRVDDLHHRVLKGLSVLCDLCGKVTRLVDLTRHTNSKCTQFIVQPIPGEINSKISKTLIVTDNEIRIRTGGKVSHVQLQLIHNEYSNKLISILATEIC